MPLINILAGLIITLLWVARQIANREAATAKGVLPADISFSNSSWMATGAIGILLLFWNNEFIPFFAKGSEIIIPLTASLLKGFAMYVAVINFSKISGKSLSTSSFISSTNFVICSTIIMMIFGDNINLWDIASVVTIGLVGFVFSIKGHGKVLNKQDKIAYLIIIACNIICMVSDRITAVGYSWAVHLTVSGLTWFSIGAALRLVGKHKNNKNRFSVLKDKSLLSLGFVFLSGEILLMYFIQNLFKGVIAPAIFMLAATPITMMISALKYHEGKWYEQLIFSICMILPVITFILL